MKRFTFRERHFWLVGILAFFAAFSTVSKTGKQVAANSLNEHARNLSEYVTRIRALKTGDSKIDSLDAEKKNIELAKAGKLQMIRFKNGTTWHERQQQVEAAGATWLRALQATDSAVVYADKKAVGAIKKSLSVKDTFVNSVAELYSQNGPDCGGPDEALCEPYQTIPYAEMQWNIERINAQKLWDRETGCDVAVCVVDTGLDTSHPDLGIRHSNGLNFTAAATGDDWDLNARDIADHLGHGTHVSGIIAASGHNGGIIGVAPNAQIYVAKVFGYSDYTDYATVTEAVAYCNSIGADVINMSLGGGLEFKPLTEEINRALELGTVVVVAAANAGKGEDYNAKDPVDNVTYPGRLPQVLTVSASDAFNRFAGFSSEGPAVDIMAPGTFSFTWITTGFWPTYEDKGIYSSVAGSAASRPTYSGDDDKVNGKRRYGRMSGTSMAAPHVAGAAALLKGLFPGVTGDQVVDALKLSAQNISSIPENRQGAGLVDVHAAYEYLKQ